MTVDVPLDELADAIAARVARPYLVSIRGTRPHVVLVAAECRDGRVEVVAGRRTRLNVADHPEVTLLWPLDEADPAHSLLVDGTAAPSAREEVLVVTPSAAILHRARSRPRPDSAAP